MVGRARHGVVVLVMLVTAALIPGPAASGEAGPSRGQGPGGIRITELGGSAISWMPYRVNRRGQVVGTGASRTGEVVDYSRKTAYLYDRGRLQQVSPPPPEQDFHLYTASMNDGSGDAPLNDWGDFGGAVGKLDHDDASGTYEATIWPIGDPVVPLGTLPGDTRSVALWGTADGTVVGMSESPGGPYRTFVWREGEMTDIGSLGGGFTYPTAIDSRGNVVGISSNADGQPRAFLWRNGQMVDIAAAQDFEPTAVNVRSQVIGMQRTAQGRHLLLWQNGRTVDVVELAGVEVGHVDDEANDINDRGQIVLGLIDGSSDTPQTRAFMLTVPSHWGRDHA